MKRKLGLKNSDSSLEALILNKRANQFNNTIANLEEKYCKAGKKKKNSK